MPFWNLFRKNTRRHSRREAPLDMEACKAYHDLLQLAVRARFELEKPIEPRTNEFVGDLLAHLWRDDPVALLLVRACLVQVAHNGHVTLENGETVSLHIELLQIASLPTASAVDSIEGRCIQALQAFVRWQTPHCPPTGETRYDAIITGLRACLRYNMRELEQTQNILPLDTIFTCLKIGSTLRANALYDVHCEMLLTTHGLLAAGRDESRREGLELLHRKLCASLCWLAHQKPLLWEMLKNPATSEAFWPVLDAIANIGGSDPGPMLLDALPFLSEDGKAHAIAALELSGNASALPALQQLAQDKMSPLAPLAHKAAKMILRRSKGDVTQLLRAVDSRHAPEVGETLLRSVAGNSNDTRPEELLRSGEEPAVR